MGNPGFPFRNESMSQEWREKTATRHSIVFRGTREHAKSFDLNGRGGGIRRLAPIIRHVSEFTGHLSQLAETKRLL